MATEFSYAFKSAYPLPIGSHDDPNPGTTMAVIRLTGPATSVSDGMTIADIEDDFDEITILVPVPRAQNDYIVAYTQGTSNDAETGKLIVTDGSGGSAVSGGTDLSGVTWDALVIGSGPLASTID